MNIADVLIMYPLRLETIAQLDATYNLHHYDGASDKKDLSQ